MNSSNLKRWCRVGALVGVLAAHAVTVSAADGATSERRLAGSDRPLASAPLTAAAMRRPTWPLRPEFRRFHTQDVTDADARLFFKTKTGVIALMAIAVGTGYALYSAQHDRVNSPGR